MKILLFLSLVLLLGACNFAPCYRRPCPDIPCSWRVESSDMTTLANVRFWEELGDPILNALIVEALANNKDLRIAVWRVCEFQGKFQVVRSALLPQVNVQATAMKEKFPVSSVIPAGINTITPNYQWAFTLAWEIDLFGKLRNQTSAAFAEWMASVEDRRSAVLSLVGTVAQAYVFLRQLDRELVISKRTLADRKEALQIAIYRFEGGLTSEIEVTQAESAYEQAAAEVTILEAQIPIQENLISLLVGRESTCILRGKEVDAFQMPCEIPAGLPSELLIRRPDILSAESLLIAANAQIGAARAEFFPQFSLTGLYGGISFQLSTLFSGAARTWNIAGNVLQPLLTGGRLKGQLSVSVAQFEEALYRYQEVVLNAFREVNDALVSHQQAKELVYVQQKNVDANKEYLKLSWYRYYEGLTDYLTVLNAQEQLFTAEINLTEAQGNVFLTLIDIYKALGGGWVVEADCTLTPRCCSCN